MQSSRLRIALCVFASGCSAGAIAAETQWSATTAAVGSNHVYTKVVIGYRSDGCSFQVSPVDYCDAVHLAAIEQAIATRRADFNGHYIVLAIPERREYFQRSVVAIDTDTGEVYPLPIDFYSGVARSKATSFGKLSYRLNSDELCIRGSTFAYHEQRDGTFCYRLRAKRFEGPRTPYTDP